MKSFLAQWGMIIGIVIMVIAALYLGFQILQNSYTNDTLLGAFLAGLIGLVIYILGERSRLTRALDE